MDSDATGKVKPISHLLLQARQKKSSFWNLGTLILKWEGLEPQIIILDLYSVTRDHVLKCQKDLSTTTKVIAWKPF